MSLCHQCSLETTLPEVDYLQKRLYLVVVFLGKNEYIKERSKNFKTYIKTWDLSGMIFVICLTIPMFKVKYIWEFYSNIVYIEY